MVNSPETLIENLRNRDGTYVLMYHSVVEEKTTSYPYAIEKSAFTDQIDLLRKEFEIVSVDELFESGDHTDGPRFVLTFDDGYRNFRDHVYPLLRDGDIPATVFLAPGLIENPGETFMNWKQIKELTAEPLVEIGSHGCRHWNLKAMHRNDCVYEIEESRKILGERLSCEIRYFSYPFGNHNAELQELVQQSGYDAAFKARMDRDFPNDERYHLGRIGIDIENSSPEPFLESFVNQSPIRDIHGRQPVNDG